MLLASVVFHGCHTGTVCRPANRSAVDDADLLAAIQEEMSEGEDDAEETEAPEPGDELQPEVDDGNLEDEAPEPEDFHLPAGAAKKTRQCVTQQEFYSYKLMLRETPGHRNIRLHRFRRLFQQCVVDMCTESEPSTGVGTDASEGVARRPVQECAGLPQRPGSRSVKVWKAVHFAFLIPGVAAAHALNIPGRYGDHTEAQET